MVKATAAAKRTKKGSRLVYVRMALRLKAAAEAEKSATSKPKAFPVFLVYEALKDDKKLGRIAAYATESAAAAAEKKWKEETGCETRRC